MALLVRTASDTLGTSDSATRAAILRVRTAADSLGTSDAAVRAAGGRLRIAHDALGTFDNARLGGGVEGAVVHNVVAPLNETLDYYSGLPFRLAQMMLGSFVAPRSVGGAVRSTVGWHGADYDDREGSVAIAREGGPLAGLVGQVAKIEHDRRVVYVHVFKAIPMEVAEDLSVSRRVYLALDLLWTSSFDGQVTART